MVAPALPLAGGATANGRSGFFLTRASFSDLRGFEADDHLAAFRVFALSCAAIAARAPPLRAAVSSSPALEAIAHTALRQSPRCGAEAKRFFETRFTPCRICVSRGDTSPADRAHAGASGFLTAYYEPVVDGSLTKADGFTAPVLGRPINLSRGARYHDRAAIDSGASEGDTAPVVWLRDTVEVFIIQVQGSAKLRLADGRFVRLVYAGRNGHPYTSIGRILIERGEIAESAMSLAALKHWIRANGQNPGDAGRALMHQNKSYVFFSLQEDDGSGRGPLGGQGIQMTGRRSIAADRTIWSYGLPFWLSANLPWRGSFPSPFQRLMIAQDTGSAITGPARFDIFFGSGDDAGARAGDIRHRGAVYVLLPANEASDL
jgi:membrane-bound lytic murein transglycosylase A